MYRLFLAAPSISIDHVTPWSQKVQQTIFFRGCSYISVTLFGFSEDSHRLDFMAKPQAVWGGWILLQELSEMPTELTSHCLSVAVRNIILLSVS
jgi:hypothetical protein